MKMLPVLVAAFLRRKRPVGQSWRMDETCVTIGRQWKCLYRAGDRDGDSVNFFLRAKRDHVAARAFFERAIDLHGVPEKITIDKSGAPSNRSSGRCSASASRLCLASSRYCDRTRCLPCLNRGRHV